MLLLRRRKPSIDFCQSLSDFDFGFVADRKRQKVSVRLLAPSSFCRFPLPPHTEHAIKHNKTNHRANCIVILCDMLSSELGFSIHVQFWLQLLLPLHFHLHVSSAGGEEVLQRHRCLCRCRVHTRVLFCGFAVLFFSFNFEVKRLLFAVLCCCMLGNPLWWRRRRRLWLPT